ncbi:inositol 2-dehydrogenase [Sediminicurvatus halobius]|uniref:Inositol 2-dehydrogenase n=1 Tax=Sediminicurvatus halobius TaxID=2182432 RepID=A0A2U2N7K0_9GAMM|nr:inositol 2-dehydrogenase [Spiribacter halobius]PWG64959.1 inositol 2-dehydrogenase [Spiribacter halobius]UEX78184.1 inositol 2-dehydrogenase [Spiribacter halobius]
MLAICQFGAGRIGAIHAANVAASREAVLRYVVDVNAQSAATLAERHGAATATVDEALADPAVDAVIIASSTDTHAELIEAAARAGKATFCEKPIDLSMARVEACLGVVRQAGVPLAIGFNRRFDPNFAAIRTAIAEGRIGPVELVQITSRDPAPPPPGYIPHSGGLFRDMTIHDFDMARWMLGEEPDRVFAVGSCLVDAAIGEAGDVDTAVVTLTTPSGRIAQISNSRRAAYGYDQRLEVLGARGMLRAENETPTRVEYYGERAVERDRPLYFFLERYTEAFRRQLEHFITVVREGRAPLAGGEDGRAALRLADAAQASLEQGRAVQL